MDTWGGLNPALTSWRNGINKRLPGRDRRTDGARADKAHSSTSQHQEDADGTVDAFDMDINLLKSSVSTGSVTEDRIVDALKLDFEQDPHRRGQLWIEDREIANADIDNWRERPYSGDSPHTEHIHWQSRQSREHIGAEWPMPNTDRLLRELGLMEDDVTPEDIEKIRDAVLFDRVIPDYSQPEKDPVTGKPRRMLSLAIFTGYEDVRWKATLAAIESAGLDTDELADKLAARLPDDVTPEELAPALLIALRQLFSPETD